MDKIASHFVQHKNIRLFYETIGDRLNLAYF